MLGLVAALGRSIPFAAQVAIYAVLSAAVFFRFGGIARLDEIRGLPTDVEQPGTNS